MIERRKFIESPDVTAKYDALKDVGLPLFKDNIALNNGEVGQHEVELARQFLSEGARRVNPAVKASYWSHVLTAPQIGRLVAERAQAAGIDVNPDLVEFGLWFHEVGRLVTPGDFFHNDLIADRLQTAIGIPRSIFEGTDTLGKIIAHTGVMVLEHPFSEAQMQFEEAMTPAQLDSAKEYFDLLTPAQRIANLADNLSKRTANGELFTRDSFIEYLRTQDKREREWKEKESRGEVQRRQESPRASIRYATSHRREGSIVQLDAIDRTIDWLKECDINWEDIRGEFGDYDTKLEVVVRHGDVDNPGIVYNRDTVMRPEDIIHLSEAGRQQMRAMGQLLEDRGFIFDGIEASPETRAQESAAELNTALGLPDIETSTAIDDVYGPGPYLEGMKMEDFTAIGGDGYGGRWQEQYGHESASSVVERMNNKFWETVNKTQKGHARILVSHGDPIAWLANTLLGQPIPSPSELRTLRYPPKGDALLVVMHPDGTVFTDYMITNPLTKQSIY